MEDSSEIEEEEVINPKSNKAVESLDFSLVCATLLLKSLLEFGL